MWLLDRFRFAWQGICSGFRHDSSIRLQMALGILTLGAGLFFHVSRWEWIVLFLCIAIVIAVEFLNSAIENCVDYISLERHKQAALIKDLAAGAVLVVSFFSFLVACLIFFPHVQAFFHL